MRKGKSVIGKPILSLEDGLRVQEVKDVILGAENDAIVGLLVDEGGLFSGSHVVPMEEVTSIGRDAVVVRSQQSVISANSAPGIADILDRKQSLLGTKVYTETGDDQGKVADLYFDERSGHVLGLEVSGGTLSDVASGARYLPVDDILRIGPDVLYVRPETASELEQQRGGVTGAFADAGDKARDTAGKATTAAGAAAADAKNAAAGATDKARTAAGDARTRAGEQAGQARPEDRLIGRRTGKDVEDDTGSVIVPAGRRVTSDDVERARAANKLQVLTTSVGVGEASLAGEGAKDALGDAGDSASSLWDQFTRKLGEVTDSTGRRMDEEQTKRRLKQIEDAVGRPVTKVILDLDDKVILDLGDVITHTAIQRAHETGALDSLLDSVYKGDVSFTKEEMRARRPGEANLEAAQESTERPAIVEELRGKVETAERERQEQAETKKAQAEADRQQREAERQSKRGDREAAAAGRKQEAADAQQSTGSTEAIDADEGRTAVGVGPGRGAVTSAPGPEGMPTS